MEGSRTSPSSTILAVFTATQTKSNSLLHIQNAPHLRLECGYWIYLVYRSCMTLSRTKLDLVSSDRPLAIATSRVECSGLLVVSTCIIFLSFSWSHIPNRDNTAARTLSAAIYFDFSFNTQEACINFCDERHYTIAGVEFGSVCTLLSRKSPLAYPKHYKLLIIWSRNAVGAPV